VPLREYRSTPWQSSLSVLNPSLRLRAYALEVVVVQGAGLTSSLAKLAVVTIAVLVSISYVAFSHALMLLVPSLPALSSVLSLPACYPPPSDIQYHPYCRTGPGRVFVARKKHTTA